MEFTNISSDNKLSLYRRLLMQAYILQDFGDQPNIPNYKHFRYIWITLGCDMYITSLSTISCMHTITHTHHSDTHLCVYVCKQACMYTHVRMHKHTRMHTHTHTQTYTMIIIPITKCKQHTYAQWKKAVHQCHITMNIVQYIPI